MVDVSQYRVCVVKTLTEKETKGGKPLKICQVDVGGEEHITVVTSATNVREGSRLALAPIGSRYIDETGEEAVVKTTPVGGVKSEGMFCDSRMLGWQGGAENVAAQMPAGIAVGAHPPADKPTSSRSVAFEKDKEPEAPLIEVIPLFEKKLTKEEKKKLAEEKRQAKRAAKDAKK